MPLPPVLAIHVHEVTTGVVVIVAFIALGLALVGHRAWRASANRNLAFVTAAFGVFALKNAFTAWAVWTGAVKHEHLELATSIVDLLVIGLLAFPLVTGRSRSPRR